MKNALIICDLVFALAFGFGLGVMNQTDAPSGLLFFVVPMLFLTGFILIEID